MNMKNNLLDVLRHATDLLRSGHAVDATDQIQRALRGETGAPANGHAGRDTASNSSADAGARAQPPHGAAPDPFAALHALKDAFGAMHHDMPAPGTKPAAAAHAPERYGRGQFLSKTCNSAAGSRNYKLYVPPGYRGEPLPAVMMLHGCTQDPDDFARGTGMNLLADQTPCLVIYPAQPQSANMQRCWNWFKPSDQARGHGEPAILAAILDEVALHYRVDPERVYVAGLSAGGAMAAILAQAYPERFAAVGVHSGLPSGVAHDLPSALAAMKGGIRPGAGQHGLGSAPPLVVFHGDRDDVVHPRNGDALIAQRTGSAAEGTAQGAPDALAQDGQVGGGHRYTRTLYRSGAGQPLAELWTIHGAGHSWMGGHASGSFTDARGPDASREMLKFFLNQRRHRAA